MFIVYLLCQALNLRYIMAAVTMIDLLPSSSNMLTTILLLNLTTDWRRQWHPTPVLLPGKSHGQRSLVGCSPWGREESDMTERLHFHLSLACIGEGNGNPLQYSCLENPGDRGDWWADVYGVTQSRTRLKWLSSNNWFLSLSLFFKISLFYLFKKLSH